MKRIWILLLALLLLTGCAKPQHPSDPDVNGGQQQGQQNGSSSGSATGQLRQQAVAVGTQGNLWHIDQIDLGHADYPNLHVVGNNLLITEYLYRENGSSRMFLKLMDLKTGTLIREVYFDCGGYVRIQVQGDRVGLADSGDGWVKILDASLQVLESYDVDSDWGEWIFSPDMKYVYELHWQKGVTRIDLSSKTRTPVLQVRDASLMHLGKGELTLSYLDAATQRFCYGVLNLQTGTLEPLDLPVNIGSVARYGDQYLVTDGVQWELRHLISGSKHQITLFLGNRMEILPETGHLYTHDMESQNPTLYTMDGALISALQLPGGEWVQMGGTIAWCENWGGYFLVTASDTVKPRLLFWDPKVATTGDDLPLEPYREEETKPQTAASMLYQRAETLSARYGLDIRIAEQCALEYDEFQGQMVTDTQALTAALELLEKSLKSYPENFFSQLLYGNIGSIRIELISNLQRKDWPTDVPFSSFVAFTQEMRDHYLMVVDINTCYVGTYYHEFTHIITKRMQWDAMYREDALFQGDAWLALQPDGFSFSYDYQKLPENWGDYLTWFVDDYSMVNPAEDQARVMEYAMNAWDWSFEDRPKLVYKLAYYSVCIRDCFDTTGWPEQTLWEETLARTYTQAQDLLQPAA